MSRMAFLAGLRALGSCPAAAAAAASALRQRSSPSALLYSGARAATWPMKDGRDRARRWPCPASRGAGGGARSAATAVSVSQESDGHSPSLQGLFAKDGQSEELKSSPIFRLSPSDFAFLWKECKRCFYLKTHGLLYRPRTPFPSIFNKIDLGMKNFFSAKRTEQLLPGMPPGEFLCEEKDATVQSQIIDVGRKSKIYIRGKIDCLVMNDDQSYSIIDFKTSEISRYLDMYSRQIHAYALCLEHPARKSEIVRGHVSHMGLVVYDPKSFSFSQAGSASAGGAAVAQLTGSCAYHPIEKNLEKFVVFLSEVLDVLEGDIPPPDNSCPCCSFLRSASTSGYIHT